MEGTGYSIFAQVVTGRDQLRFKGEFAGPLDLTEVGRLPGPNPALEPGFPFGAHDLDLHVPAAGGSPAMVGRFTKRRGAWVGAVEHW